MRLYSPRVTLAASVACLALVASQEAAACRFSLDKRPLSDRMREAPLLFVGVVSASTESSVTFDVEHPIHGNAVASQPLKIALSMPKSSCSIRFVVGDRWLYGGDTVPAPSSHLGRADQASAEAIGRLRRQPDASLDLPATWQLCEADSQCRSLAYGCSSTAVNGMFFEPARRQAWAKSGNPATVNCINYDPAVKLDRPLCVARRCGTWALLPQATP